MNENVVNCIVLVTLIGVSVLYKCRSEVGLNVSLLQADISYR